MLKCLNVKMRDKGFTFLEVIIAIFLVTVGITGVFLLITRTIGTISLSFSQLTAAYLTQEGIEIVRNIRDTNFIEQTIGLNTWDEGLVLPAIDCSTGCEADYTATAQLDPTLSAFGGNFLRIDSNDFYNYTIGDPTKFKRKITIVPEDVDGDGINDILEVSVEVTWEEKGEAQSHSAQENLYNWR